MATLQEIENERIARRLDVQIPVGDYTLTLDATYMLFNVSRKDGKTVPKGLQGMWKQPEDFRKAAEKVHGPTYSVEGLRNHNPVASAARKAGIDPAAIGVPAFTGVADDK